jgi:xanthine/uracil permease
MRTTQGALIIASILNMILGFSTVWGLYAKYASVLESAQFLYILGVLSTYVSLMLHLFESAHLHDFHCRKFSPVIMSPVVCVVGLGLFDHGFPQVFMAELSSSCFFKGEMEETL